MCPLERKHANSVLLHPLPTSTSKHTLLRCAKAHALCCTCPHILWSQRAAQKAGHTQCQMGLRIQQVGKGIPDNSKRLLAREMR
mmetsp:Transcript_30065/g.79187  ORF Transcript_30065/g.79187 Transcript_30065/m.79187 type:complete len:84 (-) Transcript_30065:254-505(-)